jgi:hypothetical protein
MMKIRNLRADEIECRVQQTVSTRNGKSCLLLLYKDARCDMKILDETFGIFGWQREHAVVNNNLYCIISIWDENKKQWIKKSDVGVESNTEKEKGEASDSFKRAGVNVGIGRELYTAPVIWVKLYPDEVREDNNKTKVLANFHVSEIETSDEKIIQRLVIADDKGRTRFSWALNQPAKEEPVVEQPSEILCPACNEIVTPIKSKGRIVPPAEIVENLGMCYNCYKEKQSRDAS